MNPRYAAFSLLRRAALQSFQPQPQKFSRFQYTPTRSLNYHVTRPLRESASSAATAQSPLKVASEKKADDAGATNEPKPLKPSYDITFTCKPCSSRSTHRISKQGYHNGSVLITCPECKNRHVISDHLKIFSDTTITIEDLMREKGQLVKKGTLSEEGDLEFWEDGTTTEHKVEDESR